MMDMAYQEDFFKFNYTMCTYIILAVIKNVNLYAFGGYLLIHLFNLQK